MGKSPVKGNGENRNRWTYSLKAPQYTHMVKLALSVPPKASTIHLTAPTITDLLNPAPSSEQDVMFILDDPYGHQEKGVWTWRNPGCSR